jgi:hypothetical protein
VKTETDAKSTVTELEVIEQQLIEATLRDLGNLDDETIALTRGDGNP